jgi:hypothetical protein
MDGTFDTAPPLFKQICIIRIALGITHITSVYCLLQKKARVGYQELFQAIVDKCDELGLTLNVTKVVSDFEDGLLCHQCCIRSSSGTPRLLLPPDPGNMA